MDEVFGRSRIAGTLGRLEDGGMQGEIGVQYTCRAGRQTLTAALADLRGHNLLGLVRAVFGHCRGQQLTVEAVDCSARGPAWAQAMRRVTATRGCQRLIRSHPYGHPDPFRSVRDLGCFPARCSCTSEVPEGRSPGWLPAWLPGVSAVHAVRTAMIGSAGRLARRPDEASQVSIVASFCTIGGGPADRSAP